jgi:hypothetical protein
MTGSSALFHLKSPHLIYSVASIAHQNISTLIVIVMDIFFLDDVVVSVSDKSQSCMSKYQI